MSLLGSVFNNKAVLNTAMTALKSWMQKDGITAVFIVQSDSEDTGMPGIDVKAFNQAVGLLTGPDYEEYLQFREWKRRGCWAEEYAAERLGDPVEHCTFSFINPDVEKGVENGL